MTLPALVRKFGHTTSCSAINGRMKTALFSTGESVACSGECRDCGLTHRLPVGNARSHARTLMREFESIQRLDYRVPEEQADPQLSFAHMFPSGHGNMFGVLECENTSGETIVLRAFSSLRRGTREIDGWVPQILSADTYYGIIVPEREKIESLTEELEGLAPESNVYRDVLARRKRASRALTSELRTRYRFRNFRGQERSIADAIWPERAVPGGVGECCAPKLLTYAAVHGLRPRGLAEFYWGGAGTKVSGEFYPSCESRCQPIMGFLLCGLD